MHVLAGFAGTDALKGLLLLITHIKPAEKRKETIRQQMNTGNDLGLKVVFPVQARLMKF